MGNKWNKHLELHHFQNLAEMVLHTINLHGEIPVMRWFSHDLSQVHSLTYSELSDIMRAMFGGLHQLGLRKGDRIALCSETSHQWVSSDLGVQSLGGVLVAIYPNLKPAEVRYIINDSGTSAIICDNESNLAKVLEIWSECKTLKHVIVLESIPDSMKKPNVYVIDDFLKTGKEYCAKNSSLFNECVKAIVEDDLASLIYTSGTTGVPKGTMLTHKNFLSDATAAVAVAATLKKDIPLVGLNFFCLLPMAHSFGRCVDEYCSIYIGATLNFVGGFDPARVRKAFLAFKPTLMCAVPYFYQKIYHLVMDEVKKLNPRRQKLFSIAVNNSRIYLQNLKEGKKNPFKVTFIQKTINKIVGKVVRKKLGGNILLMISGSAAIAPELVLFFYALDIKVAEGYGLTETSPVTHLLRSLDNSDYRPNFHKKIDVYQKLGTIGPPIEIPDNPYENVQQKLNEFGELLLKGPMVMQGYWNKPEETAASLDKEGWLHTGDLAEIDEDNYVKIVGRAKVIIKLQTAKMISPVAVEQLVVPRSKLIAQLVLAGDDSRKYISCVLVPYQQPLKEYAEKNNLPASSWSEIIRQRPILELLKTEILTLAADCSDFMLPKKFAVSSKAFAMSEDYLTPSYKFKRKKIFDDLKEVIDQLYAQDDEFLIIESRMSDYYDQSSIIS